MEEEKKIQNNKYKINSDEYYYHLSPSQSMNIINPLSITKNFKNLEPQDNFKKSKQRQLLEKENKIRIIKSRINEENLFKIDNDDFFNFDKKNYTAAKRNKTKRIFQKKFSENDKDDFYKLNILGNVNNDKGNVFNNKINLNMNFVYEKKNIGNIKKLNSLNLEEKLSEIESNEKEPMDNIKKRKPDKNNGLDNKNEKENKDDINENQKKLDIIDLEEENAIMNNDNIVFKDIKDLKLKENDIKENTEDIEYNNNKIEYIKEIKIIENNQKDKHVIIEEKQNEENINEIKFELNKEKYEEKNETNNNELNIDKNEENQKEIEKNEIIDLNLKNENDLRKNLEENKKLINDTNTNVESSQKEETEINIINNNHIEIDLNEIVENNNITNKENLPKNIIDNNEQKKENNILDISKEKIENSENTKITKEEEKENKNININLNNKEIEKEIEVNNINDKENILDMNIKENKPKDINQKNKISKNSNKKGNKNKTENMKKESKLNKNYSKKNISKKSKIHFDEEREKEKERERFFSSNELKTKGKEVRKISDYIINNNKNKSRNKIKLLYNSPKNIRKNNNPLNKSSNILTPNSKNNHKLINRIRSINISTKSLNFNNTNRLNKKQKDYSLNLNKNKNKLSSLSPSNITKQKPNNKRSLNKQYSENNLNQIWQNFFNEEENNIQNGLDEFNEDEEIYYYEPQSIVNYCSSNFTNNKKNNNKNKKFQSLSVKKENNTQSQFNNILNSTIKTLNKNLFKFMDFNFVNNIKEKKEEKNFIKNIEIDVHKLKENIDMKNKDIEKMKNLIDKTQKEIKKLDNEIRSVDSWIKKEIEVNENLIRLLNFFNMNNDE